MLSFISLSYHIQHSSNLYNKTYFDTTPLSTKQGIFLQNGNLLHGSVWRGICDDILLVPGGTYSFMNWLLSRPLFVVGVGGGRGG